MASMMALIVAKRLKSKQKARLYGDAVKPGLSPFAMSVIFCIIMVVIITLAKLKFVNETLVFAVVTCILIFIYMLKLTLFERRRPVLLAAPKHDMMWDNPLDDRLFD
jgi:ABC-type xylose transport system permease subunit